MHEYDVALKSILMRPGSALLTTLTGSSSLRWLNVELPKVNNRRMDLFGEADDGLRYGIELQARNEKKFPFRMGSYLFGAGERYGQLHRQIALYVGEAPLRMRNYVEGPSVSYRFDLVDIRDLDGEQLLASPNLGDNVVAILTRLSNRRDAVKRILKRIAAGKPGERDRAMAELLIVAGLRRLTGEVRREAAKMPILNDIMDNEVFGPLIRKGRAEGRAEGRLEGRVEGRVEGQLEILQGLVEKRFGRVPAATRKRLAGLTPDQLKAASLRVLDAKRIEDLFPHKNGH